MRSDRAVAVEDEAQLLDGLRRGDEGAFAAVMASYNAALLHVAATYVASRAVAEEVVQETWLAVIKGLDRFKQRSSLKTWIFRIAASIARTRAVRQGRCLPFSSLPDSDDERAVDPDRFFGPDHACLAGHWARRP